MEISSSFWDRMQDLQYEKFVEEALQILKCCFTEYHPQDVFLCFNGGKDCTVLLYLTLYVLKFCNPILYNDPLVCLYIQPNDPFEQVEKFVEECRQFYNLELIKIKNSVKEGLNEILFRRPNLVACLMGTRRSDPFAEHLSRFAMTDPEWPQVMRVNPILDWSYTNVWEFLRACKIPYCDLYDNGFTSIGGLHNTTPNPVLKYVENDIEKYYPAYMLKDDTKERYGRKTSQSVSKQ